jgi:hypothetical protein
MVSGRLAGPGVGNTIASWVTFGKKGMSGTTTVLFRNTLPGGPAGPPSASLRMKSKVYDEGPPVRVRPGEIDVTRVRPVEEKHWLDGQIWQNSRDPSLEPGAYPFSGVPSLVEGTQGSGVSAVVGSPAGRSCAATAPPPKVGTPMARPHATATVGANECSRIHMSFNLLV